MRLNLETSVEVCNPAPIRTYVRVGGLVGSRSKPRRTVRAGRDSAGGLGAVAAERRRSLGLTQRELSLLAGVSERSVQALEAGKLSMRADILMNVLDALGLSLAAMPKSEARRLAGSEGVALLGRPRAAERDRP